MMAMPEGEKMEPDSGHRWVPFLKLLSCAAPILYSKGAAT